MSNSVKLRGAQRAPQSEAGRVRALKHADEAFEVLLEIMRDKTAVHATRLRAAQSVIERAWGRVGSAAKAAGTLATAAAAGTAALAGPFVNAPQMDREEWIARFAQVGTAAGAAEPGDPGAGRAGTAVWRSGGGR